MWKCFCYTKVSLLQKIQNRSCCWRRMVVLSLVSINAWETFLIPPDSKHWRETWGNKEASKAPRLRRSAPLKFFLQRDSRSRPIPRIWSHASLHTCMPHLDQWANVAWNKEDLVWVTMLGKNVIMNSSWVAL